MREPALVGTGVSQFPNRSSSRSIRQALSLGLSSFLLSQNNHGYTSAFVKNAIPKKNNATASTAQVPAHILNIETNTIATKAITIPIPHTR